jgi:hypothetical protein
MAAATMTTAHAESKTMNTEQTGLEKAAPKTPAVITTPEEYRGALLRWQEQHFNVLTPFANISGMAAAHGIITSLVQVNGDKEAGEVYDKLPFLKGNEVAIAKTGLRKLAECAGISTRTERTDDRRIPFYWEFKAIASYRGIDGAIVTREATKEWDLRDGSPQMKGWTGNQVEEGRKHGLRNCEARAINAAIRECGCGIKQKYTREELSKPFVVCRVMFQPDMSDPDIKRLVTERALGGTNALYPPASPASTMPGIEVIEQDPTPPEQPRQIGGGPSNPTPAAPVAEPKKAQFPEGFGLLQKLSTDQLNRKPPKTGSFTKWTAIDHAGVQHVTIKKDFGESLEKHWNDGKPTTAIEIISEQNAYNENEISEISVHGQPTQPSLPNPSEL